ncbi:hypothetical protein [Lysobacter sp. cf310]|uniref:hypothetical protein n=1 Tax=Lysobacter sp. cf310 TaxID=1761790 RepID=UPI000B86CDC9|nr:hypothetical protein [Lysobacter sp. cf310]
MSSWLELLKRDARGIGARWDAARWWLCCMAAVTLAVYWSGLDGPFLFDDPANLSVFRDWYHGRVDWRFAVFGRNDLLSARPVSMASFLLTVGIGGPGPMPYKLGNVLIHLACGLLAFRVLQRALSEDAALAARARLLAAIAIALWWLHPIQVSTVLYSVQRMAQLAALFALVSVLAYWVGRARLVNGRARSAALLLFVAFPVSLVCGVLSKQSAAIAPLLCLVLELAYFRGPRPRAVKCFFAVFLALPMAAASLALLWSPELLTRGYADWDFSLGQRLLTQARALISYLGSLLWPRAERMSLFGDDFALSTSLLSTPSPLPALVALATISGVVFALRRRAPSLFAGWFWFLAAHTVESSVLPLEMYYEHRNYLPSLGLGLALIGVLALLPKRASMGLRPLPLTLAAAGLCALLATSTWGRVQTWRSKQGIVSNALLHHPDSLRARQTQAFIDVSADRIDAALAQMAQMADGPIPRRRLLARIDSVSIACLGERDPDPASLEQALTDTQAQITLDEVLVADLLSQATSVGRCPRITSERTIDTVLSLLAAASKQPDTAEPKRQMRLIASLLLARAQRWPEAQQQAERAWAAQAPLETADILVRAYLANGDRDAAERTWRELQARVRPYDRAGQHLLGQLRGLIEQH